MDRKSTHLLRNGPEKIEAPNRKDPLEFDTFLTEWRRLLINEGGAWDGVRVVAELKAKGMVKFLLCEEQPENEWHWQERDLFERVLVEMRLYRQEAKDGLIKECYDDTDRFLRVEAERIQKQVKLVRTQEVSSLLQYIGKKVERERKTLQALKKRRQEWHFGESHRLWAEVPRKNLVRRKIELDTRLQVEIGEMFADYLIQEGISVVTIARLIVLAYFTGKLAAIDDGMVRTIYTSGVLKVRNIRDILRGTRIGKGRNL